MSVSTPTENIVPDGEPCKCIELTNKALEEHNTILDTSLWLDLETTHRRVTVRVAVCKRDSRNRKRAMPIIPTFCPFCGKRYQSETQP